MSSFREYITEAKHKDGEIQSKDWDRMMDLILAGKDGAGVASKINDKNKAIARYVAGTKLEYGDTLPKSMDWSESKAFGEKAIELGATEEEINAILTQTTIPPKTAEKYATLKTKELDNRFVGAISKAILKLGCDIEFLGKGGNAITSEGRDAMSNGRKWTIGYRTAITSKEGVKYSLVFDAITDEGDGPTSYVVDEIRNLDTDAYSHNYNVLGQRKFLAWIEQELK